MDTETKSNCWIASPPIWKACRATVTPGVETGQTDDFPYLRTDGREDASQSWESRQVKIGSGQFKAVFTTLDALTRTQLDERWKRARIRPCRNSGGCCGRLLLEFAELRDRAGSRTGKPCRTIALRPSWFHKRDRACSRQWNRPGNQPAPAGAGSAYPACRPGWRPWASAADSPYHARRDIDQRQRCGQWASSPPKLRKGFHWEDELLRVAEVKVNRRSEQPSLQLTTDNES